MGLFEDGDGDREDCRGTASPDVFAYCDLPDDGFLDALKATASEEWENGTDEIDGEYGDGEDEETTSI